MSWSVVQEKLRQAFARYDAGALAEAESLCREILAIEPNSYDATHLLGLVLSRAGRSDDAIRLIERAAELRPDAPEVWCNLGAVLLSMNRLGEAEQAFRRAIALNPGYVEAQSNLGVVLRRQRRFDEAIASLRAAAQPRPEPQTLANLANTYREAGRMEESIEAARQAIALAPGYAYGHAALGAGLEQLDRFDEAAAALARAVEIEPRAEWYYNLALVELQFCEVAQGLTRLGQALRLRPDFARAHSAMLFAMHNDPSADAQTLAAEHRRWGAIHADRLAPGNPVFENDRSRGRRLRVGYVSPNFRSHAVATFLEPLFENHDHEQFEIVCYSDVAQPDAVTQRLRALADRWVEAAGAPDDALAEAVRRDRVDILVDLTGHLVDTRLLAFARRPAPVQVTYLGYPDSTGMTAMDYRFTDSHHDPVGATELLHTEKLIRLEPCAWCYRPRTDAAPGALPASRSGHVMFGSLNGILKINGTVIEAWSKILHRVGGSRLMLLAGAALCGGDRLIAQFGRHGIAAERIRVVGRLPYEQYMRLFEQLDIALDPFPYNGHTTTCNALWMGVPVITLAGRTHVQRAGVSVLSTIGETDLIGASVDDYIERAVALAHDRAWIAELRTTLRQRMRASPLCDGKGFAMRVEAAYRDMWRNFCGPPV